jgi:hypothetical protein
MANGKWRVLVASAIEAAPCHLPSTVYHLPFRMSSRDADIDRLFQLSPNEFTKARNALAAQAGSAGAEIRRLEKPPLAAWAVNQLFWKRRSVYDALIESAEALRRANKAVLTGHKADIRAAGRAHEEALDAALKETVAVSEADGQAITDATRQAISKTLRALPSEDTPGRLTRTLQPGGFEMLAGISPAARPPKAAPKELRDREQGETTAVGRVRARQLARGKDQAAAAVRALREAEQRARRDEFEKARAAREAEKASAQMEQAREALAEAERAVQAAERGVQAAQRAREKAEDRAKESAAAVTAARDRAEAAQAALDALK